MASDFFVIFQCGLKNEITFVNIVKEVLYFDFLHCFQQKGLWVFLLTQKHNAVLHLNIIL